MCGLALGTYARYQSASFPMIWLFAALSTQHHAGFVPISRPTLKLESYMAMFVSLYTHTCSLLYVYRYFKSWINPHVCIHITVYGVLIFLHRTKYWIQNGNRSLVTPCNQLKGGEISGFGGLGGFLEFLTNASFFLFEFSWTKFNI